MNIYGEIWVCAVDMAEEKQVFNPTHDLMYDS